MILNRLKQYIDYRGISVAAFEKSIGMANASYRNSLKNNGTIGCDKLERILSVYPDLDSGWLITGKGSMLKISSEFPVDNHTYSNTDSMKIIDRIKAYIKVKGLTNASFEKKCSLSSGYIGKQVKRNADMGESILFRILEQCSDLSKEWLFFGEGDMFTRSVATDRKAKLTILDRLSIFMNAKDLNNNKITIQCGLSNGLLGNAFKSGNGLNSDTIEKLLRNYPDLSADWLLTGRGSMLLVPKIEEIGFNSTSETENVIKLLLQELSQKNEEIGRLKEQIYTMNKKEGQP